MPRRPSPPRRPGRDPRSQEARSAATRAKVVTAATECVAALGLRAATLAAIADRAGVTHGAIQHQFGEKEALLDAVLEAAIEELRTQFARIQARRADPVGRVHALMASCREVLAGPLYRAFFEIQLARGRESDEQSEAWSEYIDGQLAAVWADLFGDLGLSDAQLEDAQRFLTATLNGIAAEGMLFPSKALDHRSLEILEDTLLRLLELDP